MIQIYVKGPTPSWDWPGVCEVDTKTNTYIHHPKWPERNLWGMTQSFFETDGLTSLVADGKWTLYQDPWLTVPEGL